MQNANVSRYKNINIRTIKTKINIIQTIVSTYKNENIKTIKVQGSDVGGRRRRVRQTSFGKNSAHKAEKMLYL